MTEIRRLTGYIRPYTAHLVGGLVAAAMVAVAWLYVPKYLGDQIDAVIRTGSYAVLNWAALVVLGIYVFRSVCLYIQLSLLAFVGHRLVADLRLAAFRQVQRWSLDRFASWHSGEVISRTIQDTQLVESRLLNGLVDLLTTGLLVFGVIIALFL
ncbi:MAG: hypothetical protein E6H02_07290, partial [Bacillati bacterium ANGP1]